MTINITLNQLLCWFGFVHFICILLIHLVLSFWAYHTSFLKGRERRSFWCRRSRLHECDQQGARFTHTNSKSTTEQKAEWWGGLQDCCCPWYWKRAAAHPGTTDKEALSISLKEEPFIYTRQIKDTAIIVYEHQLYVSNTNSMLKITIAYINL